MSDLSAAQLASLREQLDVLRSSYGEKLAQKVADIHGAWAELQVMGEGAERETALASLHRLTHTVAGSGATFGFVEAGDAARRAELILKELIRTRTTPGEAQKEAIEAALAALSSAARLAPPAAEVAEDEVAGATDNAALAQDEQAPASAAHRILLLTDQPQPPAWAAALSTFGYDVRVSFSPAELQSEATKGRASVIVVDCSVSPMEVTGGGLPLSAALAVVQKEAEKPIPVVWTCQSGDLEARIEAVRLGGAAFFAQPVDADALLVKLDDLTVHHQPGPFRVLIVDDEPALGRLFSLILMQAGMLTMVVSNPFEIMAPLVDFRPDIILMDVYMPGCTGVELAAVIRQQEAYLGIPIVFLSVETDVLKQLEAMRQGGDDFLMKPVQPRQLVAAVTTRAARARSLQQLMQRDSLTGLLNHTKTKEQLEIELDRARRQGHSLALAMLDLDNFKQVNDVYGHATGDRVLRSLARMLQQRMRQTDVIGRYGGEEFAIIMSGTDRSSASRVLEKVRHAFACLKHWSGGEEFRVTFSAGIATAPPHVDAASLSESADAALYQAKHQGRNRVVLADDTELLKRRTPL